MLAVPLTVKREAHLKLLLGAVHVYKKPTILVHSFRSSLFMALMAITALLVGCREEPYTMEGITDHRWMNVNITAELQEVEYLTTEMTKMTLLVPVVVARGVTPDARLWIVHSEGLVSYKDWSEREVERVMYLLIRGRRPLLDPDRSVNGQWGRRADHWVRTVNLMKRRHQLGDDLRYFVDYEIWTQDKGGTFRLLKKGTSVSERLPEYPDW